MRLPEPDRFSNDDSGNVALVEIDLPGQPARSKKIPVASLAWRAVTFDFLSPDAVRTSLAALIAELVPFAGHTGFRVTLTGTASPTALQETRPSTVSRGPGGRLHMRCPDGG